MSDLFSINKTSFNGVAALQIRRRECTALVSLLGGQVMSFQPTGERPVLWHNPDLVWAPGEPLRQGIPVCWPWFGDLRKNPPAVQASIAGLIGGQATQAHGIARSANWVLQSADEHDEFTEICLVLESAPDGIALSARYRFGTQLSCELITENTGGTAFTLSMALHSYFPVSDIDAVNIDGLDSCHYVDALSNWSQHQQAGSVAFSEETDRLYQDTPPELTLVDRGWRRRIRLNAPGSRSTVVWNPWIDKSQRLSQFGPESYRSMVCIETARVLDDVFTVAPGEQSSLQLTITSTSSDDS
ncbi:D-hexose-6-phosphate mutarotase [Allohahella marinimesophila]|uniref:Putative glucose-6-phosphate 1-epimerase n=1 Tax=Allohahella marinimesophila TaxID=1054972 RepID=A0ABP7PLR2_9GAMM